MRQLAAEYAKLRYFTKPDAHTIPQLARLSSQRLLEMEIISQVFAFRANDYVVNELIDWTAPLEDPIFRMVFPFREMLSERHYKAVEDCLASASTRDHLRNVVSQIRHELNPHPAGQMTTNVPMLNGEFVNGLQHKYEQTLLFFPSEGQTCHSFCSFCFRWPQFVREPDYRIALRDAEQLKRYVGQHPEITDLLITGGDAFSIKASRLNFYLSMLDEPAGRHIETVRFGTKALSWWPDRFLGAADADDLLELIKRIRARGRQVAIMAHYNHPRELETRSAEAAIQRLQAAGATIRGQGPMLRGVNDDPETWANLWRLQNKLGIVPYYVFVPRDTGSHSAFDVPLGQAHAIYSAAAQRLSGLSRVARGPIMSAAPGKVEILGRVRLGAEDVFALRLVQARQATDAFIPFFAKYDKNAVWFDDLEPIPGGWWPTPLT